MRRHRSNLWLWLSIIILMAIGLIIIYAIGPMRANVLNSTYGTDYDSNYFFLGQLRSVFFSLIALILAFKVIPVKYLQKFAKPLMIIAIILSALLWILSLAGSSLAKCELGECRWFNLGSFSFQPAEFLKLALIIYLADFFTRKKAEGTVGSFKDFWLPLAIVCGLSLFLVVVAQGDLGSGVSLIAIIFGMLLLSGVPMRQFFLVLFIVLVAAALAIGSSSHRMERIDAWVATLTGGESSDSTYHVENAMLAIGVGGFFGVGVGNSVQATGYLPESINDSIFAILGETFGFVGLAAILAIFLTLLLNTLKISTHSENSFNHLFSLGVFSWMLAQVVVNIMAMTGLVPVTGITLPLISYGGTSMVFASLALGFVLQISCYTSREVIKNNEDISSRRGLGGTHYASRRRSSRDSR